MTGAKKIFALAKGFRGRAKNCIAIARERVEKGLEYAYRDRKNKKRDFRGLWIQRINAGAREHGVSARPGPACTPPSPLLP
jgi:large subunit ribosomal protein L20